VCGVLGVGGTRKDLTDNVHVMAANLTEQVRGIVKVVTAVANGDLTQKLTVNAKGEVAALAETMNNRTNEAMVLDHCATARLESGAITALLTLRRRGDGSDMRELCLGNQFPKM
jgi:HAMP domain-containing protein